MPAIHEDGEEDEEAMVDRPTTADIMVVNGSGTGEGVPLACVVEDDSDEKNWDETCECSAGRPMFFSRNNVNKNL